MPIPRIFISSTCYDLKYIRENLKYFVSSLGYDAILSEGGNIFYDPTKNVQDASLTEITSCQILVLIIGGRFGSKYKGTNKSITNKEFEKALENHIPIFSLLEQPVAEQYNLWLANRENKNIDENSILYPAVDSLKIFEFIQEVQNSAFNNAIVPFNDYGNIEKYLKQQWASMFYNFLTTESQAKKVDVTLSVISDVSKKIEFITRQIVESIGSKKIDLTIKIMDAILSKLTWPLTKIKEKNLLNFTPEELVQNETLDILLDNSNIEIIIKADNPTLGSKKDSFIRWGITSGTSEKVKIGMGKKAKEKAQKNYQAIREDVTSILKENNISKEKFLSDVEK